MDKLLTPEEYLKKYPDPQKGPCIRCGAENYGLSFGGPAICPACDCGNDIGRIKQQREYIKILEDRIKELELKITPLKGNSG